MPTLKSYWSIATILVGPNLFSFKIKFFSRHSFNR